MKRTAMKNTLFIISVVILSLLLAVCVLGILLLPIKIVYADSTQEVIYAPISDLENNEYAGVSAVKILHDKGEFYIPESYYISNISNPKKIPSTNVTLYDVSYCGFDMYLCMQSDETPQTTTVTFQEDVSLFPDVRLTIKNDIILTFDDEANVDNTYTIKLLGYGADENASKIFIVASKDGENHFGFFNIDQFDAFVVPYHPIAQQERNEIIASKHTPDPDNGDIIPNTSLTLRVLLIIGICVPAVIIAFLLFKPSKNDRSQGKNTLHKNRKRNEFDYDSPRSYSSDRPNGYDDGYDRGYSRGYNDARNNGYTDDDRNRYDN